MKIKRFISLLLFPLLLTACAPGGGSLPGYETVSSAEAAEIMARESGYIILDVRTAEEFAESHIPGAINIANEVIGEVELSALPDKNQLILVYCRSGRRSKEAAAKLVSSGYTNIVEFGGIIDWQGDVVKD